MAVCRSSAWNAKVSDLCYQTHGAYVAVRRPDFFLNSSAQRLKSLEKLLEIFQDVV